MPQCFFFIEGDAEDGTVRALCLDHGREQEGSWFYEGGFGPWEVKCHVCQKVIQAKPSGSPEVSS